MNLNYNLIDIKHITEMLISRKLFSEIVNWQTLLMDYIGLLRKGQGVIKLRNGAKFTIRWGTTDKWSIHEIVLRDDYHIKDIPNDSKVIIDLGATVGVLSIYIASLNRQMKVYAFEPAPNNYVRLVNNVKQNGLSARIYTFREACAKEVGKRHLSLSSDHRVHSIVKGRSGKFLNVQSSSLKEMFVKNKIANCDLLKLDVEGAEYEILYSLAPAVFSKIKYISMEYHNLDKKGKKNGIFLQKYLEDQGFSVERKESIQRGVGNIYAINTRKKS